MLKLIVYSVMEGGGRHGRAGRIYNACEITLILLSVAAALLSTDADLAARYGELFAAIDVGAGLAFTLEYLLRIWVCVDDRHGRYSQPLAGRLRYMLTPVALIDLLAILPFWLAASPGIRSSSSGCCGRCGS